MIITLFILDVDRKHLVCGLVLAFKQKHSVTGPQRHFNVNYRFKCLIALPVTSGRNVLPVYDVCHTKQ